MYEDLLREADESGLVTKEKKMLGYDGLWYNNRIAVRSDMSEREKFCVLAEELGHYHLTVGNILDQSNTNNKKQELKARRYAYDKIIGVKGIVDAYSHGCKSIFEMADYLNVTEEFLNDAIEYYHSKYGLYTTLDNYIVYFEPLAVAEIY